MTPKNSIKVTGLFEIPKSQAWFFYLDLFMTFPGNSKICLCCWNSVACVKTITWYNDLVVMFTHRGHGVHHTVVEIWRSQEIARVDDDGRDQVCRAS